MIRYYLAPNGTANGQSYTARVQHYSTVDVRRMARHISQATSLTEADVQAVLTAFQDEVCRHLQRGSTVQLDGLVSFSLSLRGSYPSRQSRVKDSSTLYVQARVSRRLIRAVRAGARFEKTAAPDWRPDVRTVRLLGGGQALEPRTVLAIRGSRLKFDPSKPDEGVFLVPVEAPIDELRCQVAEAPKPSSLLVVVPDRLPSGQRYRVVVRNRPPRSRNLLSGQYGEEVVSR